MPRAATKADLIQASNEQFAKLRTLIDGMTDKEKSADIFPMGDQMLKKGTEKI